MNDKELKKYRTGCLFPLGMYLLAAVVMYYITLPPVITDFNENNARTFSIATVVPTEEGYVYGRTTLESFEERQKQVPDLVFLLPQEKITIEMGDIHHAVVLSDHGDWQLIEFHYSNTYMASSIYKAYADRIEAVSFQMRFSVGHVMIAIMMVVPVYLLALLTTFIRNRRARRSLNDAKE